MIDRPTKTQNTHRHKPRIPTKAKIHLLLILLTAFAQSHEILQPQNPKILATNKSSNILKDSGLDNPNVLPSLQIQHCEPGVPNFLKFMAKKMAILKSPEQPAQYQGFCFQS